MFRQDPGLLDEPGGAVRLRERVLDLIARLKLCPFGVAHGIGQPRASLRADGGSVRVDVGAHCADPGIRLVKELGEPRASLLGFRRVLAQRRQGGCELGGALRQDAQRPEGTTVRGGVLRGCERGGRGGRRGAERGIPGRKPLGLGDLLAQRCDSCAQVALGGLELRGELVDLVEKPGRPVDG
ncbi:MAG: hypothetical protein KQH57_11240 [Actinomycetales bacterium]|nr:hypothetical protein [Actinomycetales bacterium]